MRDVVLVTADSVRFDYHDCMATVDSMDVKLGITAGHYTRPSLASLLSASYEAALTARAVEPTLPSVLDQAGFTCIGYAPSPQLDGAFGFDRGFVTYENFFDAGNRGSRRREVLGQIDILRRLYHRLFPPHAKMSHLPTDEDVVSRSIEAFNAAEGPRFLWTHLMGSHRPYGRGEAAISKSLDRKALFSPESLSDAEHATIRERYEAALARVDEQIAMLLDTLDTTDPIVVFASDHGDEFGEQGQYFHQPQRKRVAPALVQVPVGFSGIDMPGERLSLVDIPPTILNELELSLPAGWHGTSRLREPCNQTITIAPWHDTATVLWQNFETRIVAEQAGVRLEHGQKSVEADDQDVPDEIQDRLRDLGYVG